MNIKRTISFYIIGLLMVANLFVYIHDPSVVQAHEVSGIRAEIIFENDDVLLGNSAFTGPLLFIISSRSITTIGERDFFIGAGTASSQAGASVSFAVDPGNNTITFNGIDYSWPSNDGDSSQLLQTDGSGTLIWAASQGVTSNSIDWDEIVDAMTLDANLTVASTSSAYTTTWVSDFSVRPKFTTQLLRFQPHPEFSITAASDTIPASHSFLEITSSADLLMTSTPTIASVSQGTILILHNTGDFTVTLQDEGQLAGSAVHAAGGSTAIEPGDVITFVFHGGTDDTGWHLLAHPSLEVAEGSGFIAVRNVSGSTITAGTPVYSTGYNNGQKKITVAPADADSATTMPAIGIMIGSLANNTNGTVQTSGTSEPLDTSSFSEGNFLYVSGTAGTFTATRPDADIVQIVATVLRSNVANGVLLVQGANVTNSFLVPNNLTDAAGLGKIGINDSTPDAMLDIVSGNIASVSLRLQGAAGQTADLFQVASSSGTAIFVIQEDGNVGIGTTAPGNLLHVVGTANSAQSEDVWSMASNDFPTSTILSIGYAQGDGVIKCGTNNDCIIQSLGNTSGEGIKFQDSIGTNLMFIQGYSGDPGFVGINTITPTTRLEVVGTASSSQGIYTNELNVALAGASTVSYSRFGIGTTGHSLTASDDLLISGLVEFDDAVFFDANITATGVIDFGGATSLEVPNSAGPTVNAAGEVAVDTATDSFNFYDGTVERVLKGEQCPTWIYDGPSALENFGAKHFDEPITVVSVTSRASGSNSVGWQMNHGADGAITTDLMSGNKSASSAFTYTAFNDATLNDGDFMELEITSASATIEELSITVCWRYTP